ncbi:unnamed protein product [Haemonchus placei]|uniref:Secreted protein n=1 Tax=Haemonchus placei TaxID=6290 RepID=A0A0N4VV33_HAEPC|nr:unnamed protein product [Haemonchus placei]
MLHVFGRIIRLPTFLAFKSGRKDGSNTFLPTSSPLFKAVLHDNYRTVCVQFKNRFSTVLSFITCFSIINDLDASDSGICCCGWVFSNFFYPIFRYENYSLMNFTGICP